MKCDSISYFSIFKGLLSIGDKVYPVTDRQKKFLESFVFKQEIKGIHGHYLSAEKLNKKLIREGLETINSTSRQVVGVFDMVPKLLGENFPVVYNKFKSTIVKSFSFFTIKGSSLPYMEIFLEDNLTLCIMEVKKIFKKDIVAMILSIENQKKKEIDNIDYVVIPEIDFKNIEKINWVKGIKSGENIIQNVICYNRLKIVSENESIVPKGINYKVKYSFVFYLKKRCIELPLIMGYIDKSTFIKEQNYSIYKIFK